MNLDFGVISSVSDYVSQVTSIRNGGNVGYIREGARILDALRFWV